MLDLVFSYTCGGQSNSQQVIMCKAESYNKCDVRVEGWKECPTSVTSDEKSIQVIFSSEIISDQLSGYE